MPEQVASSLHLLLHLLLVQVCRRYLPSLYCRPLRNPPVAILRDHVGKGGTSSGPYGPIGRIDRSEQAHEASVYRPQVVATVANASSRRRPDSTRSHIGQSNRSSSNTTTAQHHFRVREKVAMARRGALVLASAACVLLASSTLAASYPQVRPATST